MALQDLTPQLRTRLSRMERAVGWFVALAMALLVFGFVYYVYHTAESKGWFLTKAPYYTYTDRATGLKVGDPVMLMGLAVGQITQMEPMPPEDFHHNIYVEFEIKDPYYGYLWTEGSRAKVTTADLLGKRVLEVTKGTGGYPTYIFNPLREVSMAEAQSLPDSTQLAAGAGGLGRDGHQPVGQSQDPADQPDRPGRRRLHQPAHHEYRRAAETHDRHLERPGRPLRPLHPEEQV